VKPTSIVQAPSWKLATLYEAVMRHHCRRERHASVPCKKCGVRFIHNTVRHTATFDEVVKARDKNGGR
jgi:hypothetical protein